MYSKLKQKIISLLKSIISFYKQYNIICIIIFLLITIYVCHKCIDENYKFNPIPELWGVLATFIIFEGIWHQQKEKEKKRREEEYKKRKDAIQQFIYTTYIVKFIVTIRDIFNKDFLGNMNLEFKDITRLLEVPDNAILYCKHSKLAYHYYFQSLINLCDKLENKMSELVDIDKKLFSIIMGFYANNLYTKSHYKTLKNRENRKSDETNHVSMLIHDRDNILKGGIIEDLEHSRLPERFQIYPKIFEILKYNIEFIRQYSDIIKGIDTDEQDSSI